MLKRLNRFLKKGNVFKTIPSQKESRISKEVALEIKVAAQELLPWQMQRNIMAIATE